MKLSYEVWGKFESKGKPELTVVVSGAVSQVLLELARWVSASQMNHYMRVTLARTEAELQRYSRDSAVSKDAALSDMLAEFEGLLDGLEGDGFVDESSETGTDVLSAAPPSAAPSAEATASSGVKS